MLPGWADCARRAAAKQYPELLKGAGFETRKLLPSIGAAVGTAAHAGAAHLLRIKKEWGGVAELAKAETIAFDCLLAEIAPGAEWDDTTPNSLVAQMQIRRLLEAYIPIVASTEPAEIEKELRAESGDWEFVGHVDLFTADGHLDDLKTGAVRRPYQAQLGGYVLLAKANGLDVKSIGITFVRRGKRTKPQPPAERQFYDLDTAERAAWSTIGAIKRDVEAFEKTGDPDTFLANPMSMMCSKRYCPAWGTSFCKMHMPAHDGIEPVCD